ncbi:MAG: glycerate kinase [Actinomycetota bacterium]
MRVLAAPDKFRGTLTAAQAASAIAAGWRRERPADEVDEVPMADGGDGTLDALVAALGGELRSVRVSGPLGDPVDASFGMVDTPSGPTAVIELARASGLALVGEARRNPLRASSRGTGELVLAAAREGAGEILVCLGGSASTDGGAGIAAALGVRLLDRAGRPVPDGGRGLLELDRVDATGLEQAVRRLRVVVACDVDDPLIGPSGAARVYGPQKGASPEDVLLLERALAHYAAVIHRDLGIDLRALPGGGAAGGTGAGLVAFLGARLRPGVAVVIDALDVRRRIGSADVLLTGEGRLDASSLRGKVISGLLVEAQRAAVPMAVLCGRSEIEMPEARVASLVDRFGEERAMGDARNALEDLAAEVALDPERLSSPP